MHPSSVDPGQRTGGQKLGENWGLEPQAPLDPLKSTQLIQRSVDLD